MNKRASIILILLLVFACQRQEIPLIEVPSEREEVAPPSVVVPPPVITPQASEPSVEEDENETTQEDTTAKIIPMNAGFDPKEVTINIGDTVTWKNVNANRIGKVSSTIGGFQSPRLEPGQEWSYTFTKNGTFKYIDATLTTKNGMVIVR